MRFSLITSGFNTQPPEGGCSSNSSDVSTAAVFQHTATRRWLPKLPSFFLTITCVSTHSHPKVAAYLIEDYNNELACFNTQPPEGGCPSCPIRRSKIFWFQHTATRRWLRRRGRCCWTKLWFQHTATRRWLLAPQRPPFLLKQCFNTQPPEGGCKCKPRRALMQAEFQHTATRRWLPPNPTVTTITIKFQHTATRRWLLL